MVDDCGPKCPMWVCVGEGCCTQSFTSLKHRGCEMSLSLITDDLPFRLTLRQCPEMPPPIHGEPLDVHEDSLPLKVIQAILTSMPFIK